MFRGFSLLPPFIPIFPSPPPPGPFPLFSFSIFVSDSLLQCKPHWCLGHLTISSQIPSREEETGYLWGKHFTTLQIWIVIFLLTFCLGLPCPKEREVFWKWLMIWLDSKSKTWKEHDYRIGTRKFRGEECGIGQDLGNTCVLYKCFQKALY